VQTSFSPSENCQKRSGKIREKGRRKKGTDKKPRKSQRKNTKEGETNMKKMKLEYIPVDKIEVNWDFRTEKRDKDIADGIRMSIEDSGLAQPIKARPKGNKFEVVSGRGRLEQLKKLGKKEIPVVIDELNDLDAKVQSLVENIQRQNLTSMEMATAFEELVKSKSATDFTPTYEWLHRKTGLSLTRVKEIMSYVEAPEPVKDKIKEAVSKNKLSPNVAVEILGRTKKSPDVRQRVIETAIKKGVGKTRPAVRQIIKDEKEGIEVEKALKTLKAQGLITVDGQQKKTPDDYVNELIKHIMILRWWLRVEAIAYLSPSQRRTVLEELKEFREDRLDPFMDELEDSFKL
jgi:ParB family chromosome partitioning protein